MDANTHKLFHIVKQRDTTFTQRYIPWANYHVEWLNEGHIMFYIIKKVERSEHHNLFNIENQSSVSWVLLMAANDH